MNEQASNDLAVVNPNWAGFVLLVTLLSLLNQFLLLVIPENEDAKFVLQAINLVIGLVLWLDFFYLLRVSPNKREFLTKQYGWMVLLGSLPALRFLRLIWFWLALRANNRSLRDFLSRIVVKQDGQGTLLLIVFIALVVFEFAVVAILELEERLETVRQAIVSGRRGELDLERDRTELLLQALSSYVEEFRRPVADPANRERIVRLWQIGRRIQRAASWLGQVRRWLGLG